MIVMAGSPCVVCCFIYFRHYKFPGFNSVSSSLKVISRAIVPAYVVQISQKSSLALGTTEAIWEVLIIKYPLMPFSFKNCVLLFPIFKTLFCLCVVALGFSLSSYLYLTVSGARRQAEKRYLAKKNEKARYLYIDSRSGRVIIAFLWYFFSVAKLLYNTVILSYIVLDIQNTTL